MLTVCLCLLVLSACHWSVSLTTRAGLPAMFTNEMLLNVWLCVVVDSAVWGYLLVQEKCRLVGVLLFSRVHVLVTESVTTFSLLLCTTGDCSVAADAAASAAGTAAMTTDAAVPSQTSPPASALRCAQCRVVPPRSSLRHVWVCADCRNDSVPTSCCIPRHWSWRVAPANHIPLTSPILAVLIIQRIWFQSQLRKNRQNLPYEFLLWKRLPLTPCNRLDTNTLHKVQ